MKKEKELRAKRAELDGCGRVALRQYRVISKEIREERERLAELSSIYADIFGRRTGHDGATGRPDGMPIAPELEGYRRLIEENYLRCVRMLEDIQSYINSIDDSETRMIFRMHYINGWSWQKIAFKLDGSDESRPRKLHERYLKKHPFRSESRRDGGGDQL